MEDLEMQTEWMFSNEQQLLQEYKHQRLAPLTIEKIAAAWKMMVKQRWNTFFVSIEEN